MIKVKKDLGDVPDILTAKPTRGNSRLSAFDENISNQKNVDEKNLYKVPSIQKKLKDIYHLKCAYCEKELLDSPKNIEHYRPKSIYYWLIYSWDNLFLSCGECNSIKKNKFKVTNKQVIYNDETFDTIHQLGTHYDASEEPYIINPEKDDILEDIIFDAQANISSLNPRVKHTIEIACKLNRKELVQKRIRIVNIFKKKIIAHWWLFKKNDYTGLDRFKPDIQSFLDECKEENDFFALRYFILHNIEVFFDEKPLVKILKILIVKYDTKGIINDKR